MLALLTPLFLQGPALAGKEHENNSQKKLPTGAGRGWSCDKDPKEGLVVELGTSKLTASDEETHNARGMSYSQ